MATEIAKQLGNERKQEREQNQKERQSELHTDMAAELREERAEEREQERVAELREERAEEREQERVAELREERAMPRKFDSVWPMIDANYQNNVPHLLRKVLVYLACHTDFNDAATKPVIEQLFGSGYGLNGEGVRKALQAIRDIASKGAPAEMMQDEGMQKLKKYIDDAKNNAGCAHLIFVDREGEVQIAYQSLADLNVGENPWITLRERAEIHSKPYFEICTVFNNKVTSAFDETISTNTALQNALKYAREDRTRFYTEREKEFGSEAWPSSRIT